MKIAIALFVGMLLGAGGIFGARFGNVDVFSYLRPRKADAPAPVAAPAATRDGTVPKELELRRMIAEVARQKEALEARERPLAEAGAKVEQERKALQMLKDEIEAAEKRTKATVIEIDISEQINLKKLAKTWAQMDPAEAAKLVKAVEQDLAVRVMGKMTEKQSAALLGSLTSDTEGEKLAAVLVTRLKQLKAVEIPKDKRS